MTIKNVVGTIRGAVEPDRYVIIGTHRDAWVHGTADALTGTAAMIEIMTAMSKTMKVCWYALFLNWHLSFIQCFLGCDTFGPKQIWSLDIWSPTISPQLIGPSGQMVPNQFCPHGQEVPKILVPMDKRSPTNSVSMDKWSPKIRSPWTKGPQQFGPPGQMVPKKF